MTKKYAIGCIYCNLFIHYCFNLYIYIYVEKYGLMINKIFKHKLYILLGQHYIGGKGKKICVQREKAVIQIFLC